MLHGLVQRHRGVPSVVKKQKSLIILSDHLCDQTCQPHHPHLSVSPRQKVPPLPLPGLPDARSENYTLRRSPGMSLSGHLQPDSTAEEKVR